MLVSGAAIVLSVGPPGGGPTERKASLALSMTSDLPRAGDFDDMSASPALLSMWDPPGRTVAPSAQAHRRASAPWSCTMHNTWQHTMGAVGMWYTYMNGL
jgi:hypothetical protein